MEGMDSPYLSRVVETLFPQGNLMGVPPYFGPPRGWGEELRVSVDKYWRAVRRLWGRPWAPRLDGVPGRAWAEIEGVLE